MLKSIIGIAILSFALAGCSRNSDLEPLSSERVPGPEKQTHFTAADVGKALDDAIRLREEGKYAEALERHLWYHRNALKYAPAQQGVRLSFALGDWTELAKLYPKAADALREVRDQALAGYRRSPNNQMLHAEAMSISFVLGDLESAKKLFYEAKKNGIKDSGLDLQLGTILDAGEAEWAKDVIGDPMAALDNYRQERATTQFALTQSGANPAVMDSPNFLFVAKAVVLIKALKLTHGLPRAQEVQRKALEIVDSAKIRSALTTATN